MNAVHQFLTLAAALLLSGCGTFSTPRVVNVPVAVKCDADIPDVPAWATKSLKADAGIFEQAKALLAERQQALGYQDELRTALQECADEVEVDEDEDDSTD